MNASTPLKALRTRAVVVETTVFRSGNSQAIRIPKEFQFHTKRVEIRREGKGIVLRPMTLTAAEALGDLPALNESEAKDWDTAMAAADDLLPLDEPFAASHAVPKRRNNG